MKGHFIIESDRYAVLEAKIYKSSSSFTEGKWCVLLHSEGGTTLQLMQLELGSLKSQAVELEHQSFIPEKLYTHSVYIEGGASCLSALELEFKNYDKKRNTLRICGKGVAEEEPGNPNTSLKFSFEGDFSFGGS